MDYLAMFLAGGLTGFVVTAFMCRRWVNSVMSDYLKLAGAIYDLSRQNMELLDRLKKRDGDGEEWKG